MLNGDLAIRDIWVELYLERRLNPMKKTKIKAHKERFRYY